MTRNLKNFTKFLRNARIASRYEIPAEFLVRCDSAKQRPDILICKNHQVFDVDGWGFVTWETWRRGCPSGRTFSSWSRRPGWHPSLHLARGISRSILVDLSCRLMTRKTRGISQMFRFFLLTCKCSVFDRVLNCWCLWSRKHVPFFDQTTPY